MRIMFLFLILFFGFAACEFGETVKESEGEELGEVCGSLEYQGVPIAGIEVMLVPREKNAKPAIGTTDAEGSFRIQAVPGAYALLASKESANGYLSATAEITLGAEELVYGEIELAFYDASLIDEPENEVDVELGEYTTIEGAAFWKSCWCAKWSGWWQEICCGFGWSHYTPTACQHGPWICDALLKNSD